MQCFLSENDCLTVGSVQISVLKVQHDSVTLGITDPNASPSYREEKLYLPNDDDDHDEDDYGDDDQMDEALNPILMENFSPFATSLY